MAIKVEFGLSANNAIQRIGIGQEYVTHAIQSPDDIYKIIPVCGDQRDWPIISLYMKRATDGGLLLIQVLKQGGVVTVNAVWLIYPDDIGIDKSASAFEVFKAFLEKYGVHLKTGYGLTKLVMYETAVSSTTSRHGKWERTFSLPEGVLDAEDRRVTQTPEICLNKWTRQLNIKMHIAMLYTINLSNYLHDLANRRGTHT